MSKILRRPMFRGGGKVSSYGNGIATGLADGGMPGKRGLVDGPGGYSGDEIDFNLFNKNYKTQDYYEKKQGYQAYEPEFKNEQDYLNAYNKDLARQENDLLMTYGVDDYSGFQDSVANDLNYSRSDDGRNKFIDEKRTAQNKIIEDAAKYDVDKQTDLEKLLISQSKVNEPTQRTEAEIEADLLKKLKGKELTEGEELAALEKEQAFFEKVLGGGKPALIDDISTMGLNYASGALKEGATVKSSFADFFEKEAKRPSRRMKVKDAATQAAIQSYLTGKTSLQKFQNDIDSYGTKLEMKDKFDKKDLDIDALLRAEAGNNGKVTNEGVMARSFDRKYKDVPGYTGFKGEVKPDKELIEGGIYYVTEGNDRIIYIVKSGKLEEIKTIFN